MERKGYERNHDQEKHNSSGGFTEDNIDSVQNEKFQLKKKRLKTNIVEFFVGSLLLFFCRGYLQAHPAERVALLTGVDLMIQKINIRFSAQGEDLKLKYEIERKFEELITLLGGSSCSQSAYLFELKKQYKTLQQEDVEQFLRKKQIYANMIGLAYRKIQKDCKKQQ